MALNERFVNLAKKAGAALSLPWQWIYAQWAHETGGFDSYVAKTYNNYAGLTSVKGGYRSYSSDEDFLDSYVNDFLKRPQYSKAITAKSPEEFVAGLRAGGYFTDSLSNYTNGVNRWLPEGSEIVTSSGGTTVDTDDSWGAYWERWLKYNKLILSGKLQEAEQYRSTWPIEYTDKATGENKVVTEGEFAEEINRDVQNKWEDITGPIKTILIVVVGLALAVTGFVLMAKNEAMKIVTNGIGGK